MGRRISKEFLHPSILEGVNNKIGNLDSLETDAKGNMVQLSGAYCTSQPAYIVQVRFIIRGNIQ
jgi:hypothetical protein